MIIRNRIFLRILVSAILATFICLFFIDRGYKYTASVVSVKGHGIDRESFYFDLDGDGLSERVLVYKSGKEITSLIVYEWDDDLIDQVNISGKKVNRADLFSGDYNSDKKSELYLFTYSGDSLFLNVVDPFSTTNQLICRKQIDGCKAVNGVAEYRIAGSVMEDLDGDGKKEFYFSINAGFTLAPRNLFCYNLVTDSIYVSQAAGTSPNHRLSSDDLDGDGFLEIWGESKAYDNYGDSIVPYSDRSAWLMVFSHTLDFKFEPVEFEGFGSIVNAEVLELPVGKKLVVYRTYRGNQDSIGSELCLVDINGNVERQVKLSQFDVRERPLFYVDNRQIYLYDDKGRIIVFNEHLELQKIVEKEWLQGRFLGRFRLTDQAEVLGFMADNVTLRITDMRFRVLAEISLSHLSSAIVYMYQVKNKSAPEGLLIKTRVSELLISLDPNPRQHFIFLYGLIIFMSIYAFVYVIQVVQIRQEKKKVEVEKRLRTLQLRSLKSQMNPHFIFNALNSISAMYMKGDSAKAQKFLNSFSRMIREVVDSSDRVIVTLKEEMDFVRNYLELEKVRYGDNFTFQITIPDDCRMIQLPSMCIHTFVENSVKHGFPDKSGEMLIEVKAIRNQDQVALYILDNGIGMNGSDIRYGRKGRGLEMVSGILKSYTSISGKSIHYSIRNLHENDVGTHEPEKLKTGSVIELLIKV